MENMIEVQGLKKSFGNQTVLDGLDFHVKKGEVYSLLGMNGAGKTTTIRILATLSQPSSGMVSMGGFDSIRHPRKIQELISLTGQFAAVDEMFTGFENLVLIGRLRKVENPKQVAINLLERFGLEDAKDKLVYYYSGGMKRRLDIAMGLVGDPQIVFLDEPTTGLDPKSRIEVWNLVRQLKESGVTILLTTQYIEEAEQLADQVGILKDGHLIAEGTPDELKAGLRQNGLMLTFYKMKDLEIAKNLLSNYRTETVEEEFKIYVFTEGTASDFATVLSLIGESGIELSDFSKIEASLEDVFLKMNESEAVK